MSLTTIDLRNRIADRLKVSAADIPLSATNAAKIDRWIGDATAMLREKGLCWWSDNAIPQSAAIPFTLYVAGLCCADFGKQGQGHEDLIDGARANLADLRESADVPTVAYDYF